MGWFERKQAEILGLKEQNNGYIIGNSLPGPICQHPHPTEDSGGVDSWEGEKVYDRDCYKTINLTEKESVGSDARLDTPPLLPLESTFLTK